MRQTYNLLRNPFRYPEWGEVVLAGMGLLQFIFAIIILPELAYKPGLTLTVFFSPEGWAIAGLLLFSMHITSLRFSGRSWGHNFRLVATASSLAFWTHFILSIVLNSVLFDGPFPGTMVPSMGTPILAGAVLYRLWRQY